MKYFKILTILLFSAVLFFYGCNEDKKTSKQDAVKTEASKTPSTAETTKATPPLKEPAQNASGVWHYTCRIGCAGGAGSATKCENCGNILAHNTTYHANNAAQSSAPFATPTAATPASNTPEPAQNAAGVWHYTCVKGHAGGAGSAVACSSCGDTMAHNNGYH